MTRIPSQGPQRGHLSILIGLVLAVMLSACKSGSSPQASSNQGNTPAETGVARPAETAVASPAATPGAPATGQGAAAKAPSSQLAPFGVYKISEVDHLVGNQNAADMIPSEREIQFTFGSDGGYKRVSKRKGKIVLTETGTFRVDEPDQLVIIPAKQNTEAVTDGRKTSYKFTLSRDGDELKLWGPRGNVAVFHKTQGP